MAQVPDMQVKVTPENVKWEYLVHVLKYRSERSDLSLTVQCSLNTEYLNAWGDVGWELVAIYNDCAYFKRVKQDG